MKKPRPTIAATMFVLGLLLLAASVVCTPAQAALIELEPDMFRVGTNVTNLFEGVTISRYSSSNSSSLNPYTPPSYSPLYVEDLGGNVPANYDGNLAATGTRTFGNFHGSFEASHCWGGGSCGGFSAMLVQFDRPTNYFEIASSWGEMGGGDDPMLFAFDSNRQYLGRDEAFDSLFRAPYPPNDQGLYDHGYYNGTGDYAGIVRFGSLDRTPFISTIVVGGWDSWGSLDRIRFNSDVPSAGVPEPSSLLMLGFGLAGLVLWRRKLVA